MHLKTSHATIQLLLLLHSLNNCLCSFPWLGPTSLSCLNPVLIT